MMLFKPNWNKSLNSNLCNEHLSHAYIICGPAGSGKLALAETMAAAIICNGIGSKPCMNCTHCKKAEQNIHPDIIFIDKETDKREIYVDQIRAIKSDAVIMPNEADKKVYIIKNAGSMNIMAQNAMLKLLEEPPTHAAFLLITENPSWLLPTVRSRCIELNLIPQDNEANDLIYETAKEFFDALYSHDKLRILKFFFSLEKLNKNDLNEFVESSKELAADKLRASLFGHEDELSKESLTQLVLLFEQMNEYLDCNVGTGHITGLLCAELIDKK